jgi:hypothetical protein
MAVAVPAAVRMLVHTHQESCVRAATCSAAKIRKRFGVPDQATEGRMLRVFRAALRPRMDRLTRQYRTSTLRRNVKAYSRQQGCKWLQGFV